MSGKRLKKIETEFGKKERENIELSKGLVETSQKKKRDPTFTETDEIFCAVDQCRCDGTCRSHHSDDVGIPTCNESVFADEVRQSKRRKKARKIFRSV